MEQIWILGIGWQEDELTLGAVKLLRSGKRIILRTDRCECANWLKQEGIPYESLDFLFEQCYDFDELIEQTADAVLAAAETEPVLYCVNDLSDKSCACLCRKTAHPVRLIPGVSEGSRLTPYAGENLHTISASDIDQFIPDAHVSTLVRELDNQILASDVKLKLSERYPDESTIYLCHPDGQINRLLLCDLDRLDCYDHRLCALIPAVRDLDRLERYDVRHLEEIMSRLRDFDGCPWDREQTHESLRTYLVEEAYEAVDAINRDDPDDLYDELGDVLLQIIFHSDIARQYGEFEFSDVTTAICRKMIRRHPHVFAGAHVSSEEEVNELWNNIKKQEKSIQTLTDSLHAVAGSLPALMRAEKVGKRLRKHENPLPDLDAAWNAWQKDPCEENTGLLLLTLADQIHKNGSDAELCLNAAIDRLINRLAKDEANQD